MIPKRLIVTHRAERALEPKLRYCMNRMREMHPEWEWCFFSDVDCGEFVERELPAYAELYRWLPRPVLKADCFRLLAVYRLGGFYLDTDFAVESPFDPLCQHGAVFPWEQEMVGEEYGKRFPEWLADKVDHRMVGQYVFGAEAGHPFIKALLDELVCRTEVIEAEDCNDLDVLHATGPDMVSSVFYRDKERWEREIELIGSRVMGLGHYGDHHVTGSWWQG